MNEDQSYHLCKFIVHRDEPLSIVEDEDFRGFVTSLNKRTPNKGRKGLHKELTAKRQELMKAKEGMRKAGDHLAVSTDFWTSIDNHSYAAYTERWITEDWFLVELPATIVEQRKFGFEKNAKSLGVPTLLPSTLRPDKRPSVSGGIHGH